MGSFFILINKILIVIGTEMQDHNDSGFYIHYPSTSLR